MSRTSRQIRNETGVPEEAAYREIGRYGNEIEEEGRLEIRPEVALIGIGDQPVEDPDPAKVDQGKDGGCHDSKDRHGFSAAGDGGSPGGPEKEENRRDQGPGMGNPDPENELDQIDSPHDRMHQACIAHARQDLIDLAKRAKGNSQQAQAEQGIVRLLRRRQCVENLSVDVSVLGHDGILRSPILW